uniref:Protein containing THAP domain n=1 Tax=Rhipicephalus zambeziensis TaxID=60191 RepID=A0A224Z106_9ACAR
MTTDTAGAAGSETSALESSSLSKTNSFIVVTLNPSMTPAAALATGCATSGNGSAPDEAVPAGSPTTSGEQAEKLAMTESLSGNESTAILGAMGVAEEDGQLQKVVGDQPHSSKEPESNAPQVMEPRQQPGAMELTAAMTEAHPVDGGLVKDRSTPSSLPEKVTATMTPAKASRPATTPTTPPSSQQQGMTRANKKTPDGQHPELASETSNVGTKLVIQPDEGACDVCQRTFKKEDLTKIFVELRKQTVEDSPGDQLCPFMLCPECKEPLLRAPTLDGSSSMQREDIVAKLHERALNTQPATQISDEPEANDNSPPQSAEPPKSKRVQIELTREKPTNEGATVKCCVPTCANCSDKSTSRPLSFHKFPRRVFLKKQWADAIGRTDWLPTTTTVICSDHFRPNDFTDGIRGSGNLKESAIPSIFGAAIATEGASSDAGSPEVESVLYSNKGKAVVSLFQMKTPTKGRGSAETCTTSNNTRGAATKRTLPNGPSPSQVEKKKKKKLAVMDIMEVDTSSYWLKTLSNRSVNFVHIVHRPMPCIARSVTVSPDMSVMVAIENARLSLLPCGTPVPSTINSIETLQDLLDRVEMLEDTERIDNWQLRRQSTLKLVTVLLQEVCHNVGSADSQYGVLASIRDQVKDLL